jgi:hypothetical protein
VREPKALSRASIHFHPRAVELTRSPPVADLSGRRTKGHVDFMIDGFRVGYEFAGGCRCVCPEFAARESCKHTREVVGRLAAQRRIAEHLSQGATKAYSLRPMR